MGYADYEDHEPVLQSNLCMTLKQLICANALVKALQRSLRVAEEVAAWRLVVEAKAQAEFNRKEEARRVKHVSEQTAQAVQDRDIAASLGIQNYVPRQREEYKPTYRGESRYG